MNINHKILSLYPREKERYDVEETRVKRPRRKLVGKNRIPLAIMCLLKLLLEVDLDTNACESKSFSCTKLPFCEAPRSVNFVAYVNTERHVSFTLCLTS